VPELDNKFSCNSIWEWLKSCCGRFKISKEANRTFRLAALQKFQGFLMAFCTERFDHARFHMSPNGVIEEKLNRTMLQ